MKSSGSLMKINYQSFSDDYSHPGDRRRFYGFAKRKSIDFNSNKEILDEEVIILTQNCDLSLWVNIKEKHPEIKIVFDLCDAYLVEPLSFRRLFRGLVKFLIRKNKKLNFSYMNLIKKICIISDAIICSTDEQKEILKKYSNNIHIILDYQDDEISIKKTNLKNKNEKLNILWEGLGSNLSLFQDIAKTLEKVNEDYPFNLNIVTDTKVPIGLGNLYKVNAKNILAKYFKNLNNIFIYDWNKENLCHVGSMCDIAIIPSSKRHEKMFYYKSANKLFLFWKMGLPTITSYSFAYHKAMKDVNLDLICKTNHEWELKIKDVFLNKDKFNKISHKLKEYAKFNYSDAAKTNAWDKLFNTLEPKL